MKVTAKTHAFLHRGSDATPQELQTEKGIHRMQFFGDKEFWIKQGYTYVGEATITVEVPELRTLVDNKLEALREEIKTTRAEATAKVTKLEGMIQNLLCIENSAPAAADQPVSD